MTFCVPQFYSEEKVFFFSAIHFMHVFDKGNLEKTWKSFEMGTEARQMA